MNKPVSEITANDIKTEEDWQELCEKEYDRQQAEAAGDEFARPETLEMIKAKFSFLKPLEPDPVIVKEPTLGDLKKEKIAELNAAFYTACKKPAVEMDGVAYDADETANRNVAGLITSMEAGGVEKVQFCAADNSFHELTLEQLRALQLLIIEKGQALYAAKWAARAAIEEAETAEALDAIRISL